MTRKRKFLLSGLLALALVLSGGAYYAWYCFSHMELAPFGGPQSVRAEKQQYTCGMHPFVIQDKPGNCPICGMKLVPLKKAATQEEGTTGGTKEKRKILYWVAPMNPNYIRHKPGKSPMGMDLVPVYADEVSAGPTIRIDPVTIQNMGVKTATAKRETLTKTLRTVGMVTYKEPQQYSINSKISGWVERLYVNETGQFVKKGQPLMAIYSPDLVSAQQEYLLALRNNSALKDSRFPSIAQGGQSLLEASRERLRYWDISEGQIRQLEKTGKVRKNLILYAPYNGIVTQKMVTEGMHVQAGQGLLQLSDISSVWIDADVYEYELPWLKTGQSARVVFPYAPEKALEGKISYIYPYVDQKTRTTKVRLEFPNPGYKLKPQQYVNVYLQTQKVKDALVIPNNAILDSGTKQTVFVALEGGKFQPRKVKIGLQGDDGQTQILQGLADGEKVVTSAQFLLDSESQLKEAIQKMTQPQEAAEKSAGKVKGAGREKSSKVNDLFENPPKKNEQDLKDLFK
jgi:Cu(I)/Ag(I) efflux system membrane fusion protein